MSKVTIPRPVAVLWKEERPYQEPLTRLELWPPFEPLEIFDPLITTTQAEAYKDACVREALEEAAKQCEGRYQPWGNLADDRAADCMSRAAGRIRALIPSTPAQLADKQ